MRDLAATIAFLLVGTASSLTLAQDAQLAPTDQVFSKIAAENSKMDILLVGDPDHSNINIWKAFSLALPALKKASPSLDCVMLELDHRAQVAFDKFLKDPRPNTLKNEVEKVQGLYIDDEHIHVTEGILYQAYLNHLKVIAADIDFSSDLGQRLINETLTAQFFPNNTENAKNFAHDVSDPRNEAFAEKTSKLLQSHSCKEIVQLIGKDHFSPQVFGIHVESLTTALFKKDIRFVQALIFPAQCDESKPKESCDQTKELFSQSSYSLPYDPKQNDGISFLIISP